MFTKFERLSWLNEKISNEFLKQLEEAKNITVALDDFDDRAKISDKKAIGLAKEATLQKIAKELETKQNAKVEINYSPKEDPNKAKLTISVKNSQKEYQYLGTFLIDFNFPESRSFNPDTDYRSDLTSNPVVHSLLTKLFVWNNPKILTDKDLTFAKEAEALEKTLQEEQVSISEKKKTLLWNVYIALLNINRLRNNYPEKTDTFIQVLSILNKIAKNQATFENIQQLSQYANEVIKEAYAPGRLLGIILTPISFIVMGLGIWGIFSAGATPFFVIPAAFAIVLGIAGFIGGPMLVFANEGKKLLNSDLEEVIKHSEGIEQKSNVTQEKNVILEAPQDSEQPIYGKEVFPTTSKLTSAPHNPTPSPNNPSHTAPDNVDNSPNNS